MNDRFSSNDLNLIRRYLIWCYKTTKEDLDRIDRYFTQKVVDDYLFEGLINTKEYLSSSENQEYKDLIKNFEIYKSEKFTTAQDKKYINQVRNIFKQDYLYFKNRFVVIEKAIVDFLGKDELKVITDLYEGEMTQRILSARDHA